MIGNGMPHNISEPITWPLHQPIWFGFLITDSGENLWCPCNRFVYKCARDLSTERGCNVFTLIVHIISTLCKFCSMCKRPFNRWGARVIYFAQIVTFFRMYTIFAHIVQGTSQQGRVRCCSHSTKYLHMLCKGPFNREGAMVVYLHTLVHCALCKRCARDLSTERVRW